MNQLKMSVLALALTGIAASSAMAQSSKTNAWEGFYGQVGVGFGIFTPSISNGTATKAGYPTFTTSASNVNNVNTGLANLAAGYNFGINQNFILGIGATYYPGASSSATGTLNTTYNGAVLSTTAATYNVKNLYSVVLTPGYVIDKDKLAYAKVGYTGATIGLSSPVIPYNATNLTGYTLGIGYKQMVTSSIYAFGEFNYASYGSATASSTTTTGFNVNNSAKGTGTDLLVGLGYRF